MAYSHEEQVSYNQGFADGLRSVFRLLFGADNASSSNSGSEVIVIYEAEARDGLSKESRRVILNKGYTAEENLDTIREAIRRKRWYVRERENVPGIDEPLPESDPKDPAEKDRPPIFPPELGTHFVDAEGNRVH